MSTAFLSHSVPILHSDSDSSISIPIAVLCAVRSVCLSVSVCGEATDGIFTLLVNSAKELKNHALTDSML